MDKSYKFRLYPNKAQTELFEKTFGCCRFVYNEALAIRKTAYEEEGKTLNKYDCMKRLPSLKSDHPWLKEVDSVALQASLENLDAAYRGFFRRVKEGGKPGFPKFKSKHHSKPSYRTKQKIQVSNKAVKLPKVGWVKCKVSTKVQGRILSATISRSKTGKYFVSLTCTKVDILPFPFTEAVVGLDMGIKSFAVTSDGKVFENLHTLKKSEKQLARLQRQLSRKSKGSKNREKAKLKVARLHEKIANQRADALHKLSTQIVKDYDVICLEDLAVKNMVKNHHLAKSIQDTSWSEFRCQLAYKAQWHGKELVVIDKFYASSQTCSQCGNKWEGTKDLKVRKWTCSACGAHHDRDINAATNILNEGLRILVA